MNVLKVLLLSSFFFVGITHSVNAQSVLSPEQQEKLVENVTTFINDLNLSEQDKPAFRMIIEDFFIGLVALKATNFSGSTNKKIFNALVKGRDSRVKDLLSKEQYKVYKSQIKETKANLINFMREQN
ncbi:hypothetical protein [Phaeodactylibacter sp.]|uniref:hypothetical protein n=1 Tax=Phaeodactylibacter sp. TaxID=1940289 RepID=UPI002600FD2C|nr:hypothetical protein [Phaeodactylibacter sp.]MCI4647246.1 hypothetical protein [Phaeodactylibacter sp.]MCI5089600.1 hypothetical protein [Phaeodactylibacter sp.]